MSIRSSTVSSPGQLFRAGGFFFRSGIICFDEDDVELLVVYNKETGEHCLPQDRCRLSEESAPATQNRLISPAESFEATAKRALWEQTGYTCDLSGSHNRRTLQPGRRSLLACVAPTLDKTEINNAGVLKVTTWYEATVDTMASRNLYGSSLGEDWDSKWISYFDDHLSPDEVVVVKESRAVSENEEDSW